MNKIFVNIFLKSIVFLLIYPNAYGEGFRSYRVVDYICTYVESGPNDIFEKPEKEIIIREKAFFSCNQICLSKKLSSYFLADTMLIGREHIAFKIPDNELTKKYPGDELVCLSVEDSCQVGNTFMNLIGSNRDYLKYRDLTVNRINDGRALFFAINDTKIGIFFPNDFIILIFEPD